MIKLVLVGVLVCVGVAAALTLNAGVAADRYQFESFKLKFNRLYETPMEENKRFAIFRANMARAAYWNKASPSATFGVTRFSDMTKAEFRAFTGYGHGPEEDNLKHRMTPKATGPLPTSWDWVAKGAVVAVKDQGQCGSCWTFSAAAAIEGQTVLSAKMPLTSISEQQFVDCVTVDYGCSGGWPKDCFAWGSKAGVMTEAAYPYTAQDGTCSFNKAKAVVIMNNYTAVAGDSNSVLTALVNTGPLSIALNADPLMSYNGGIIDGSPANCDPNSIDHAVTLVGFSNTGSKPYYRIKNSWSASWGEQGYFRMGIITGAGPGPCGMYKYVTFPNQVKKVNN